MNKKTEELLMAALEVVTAPTVTAYRSMSYEKRVPAHKLRRLIDALIAEGVFNEKTTKELTDRLAALDKEAERGRQYQVEELERKRARNREWEEADRHEFVSAGMPRPYECSECGQDHGAPAHGEKPYPEVDA